MKIQDLLMPLIFILLTTWGIQYFILQRYGTETEITSDRGFIAPASVQVAEPLHLDVDFYDSKPTRKKEIISVQTNYGTLDFSNNGATLERLVYDRGVNGRENIIQTIAPEASKETGTFLVALDGLGKTPYFYDLLENKKVDNKTILTFKGESEAATILKEFQIYDDIYKIDLNLTVTPKGKTEKLRSRIFFSGPIITSDPDISDVSKAVFYSGKNLEKKSLKDVELFGKENPTLFGLEDHYFVNAMVDDPNKFAVRAYYKLEGTETGQAILESSNIDKENKWKLSFYFGPKELSALSKVDKRLDNILDYGWLWFISKPMLYLLNFLYQIVHSYGLAIILLTILLRLALLPFGLKGEQSMKKQQEVAKRLKQIELKYKDNPELLSVKREEILRQQMTGMLGCFTIFINIPVMIALNRVLYNSIELYNVSFLWIPDLSSRDPYYILPILSGIGMVLQTFYKGGAQQTLFNVLMAIVIVAVTSNLSAGLSLYLCVSMLASAAQVFIQKKFKL